MSFNASFTSNQIAGAPSQIVFTDTSTGSDGAIVSRVIYLATKDNVFLVPQGTSTQYILWALGSNTITVDCLDKDYCLLVTVEWLDVSGNVLYVQRGSYGGLNSYTLYNSSFDYKTTQLLSGNPILINDNNFWNNKVLLQSYVTEGNDAMILAIDQTTAQLCFDAATALRLSSQYYFNANA